tara:strand:- start:213 stop:380 length:168 start_codon:yes stop_codon:yes gene_type:complete
MKYVIKSMKVGVIGEEFEPNPGINISALLDGGFIAIQESTDTPKKTPTIKKTPKE